MSSPFQRVGSQSNAHVGRDFEACAMKYFASQGIRLEQNFSVPVGIGSKTKPHNFDLGCEEQKILVECKSHRWTSGGNVPSAKVTVWNEAMYYFVAAPCRYRCLWFVLRDYSPKRKETLAEYYHRTYRHLIPSKVEILEFDEETGSGRQI